MAGRVRIIKADELAPAAPLSFKPDDALRQIEERIQEANRQLESDRLRATKEVQGSFDQATQNGYQQGYDKGLQQGLADQEAAYRTKLADEVHQRTISAVNALTQARDELDQRSIAWQQQWEPEAIDLITSIARRVTRRLVEIDPAVAGRTLREVLALVARSPSITVHLHPTDVETLDLPGSGWRDALAKSTPVEIVADTSLTRGGCRVETEHASIDATIETQIGRLLDEIAGLTNPPSSE